MANNNLKIKVLSSLEKVFADQDLNAEEWSKGSMFLNEVYSFQVAYCYNSPMIKNVKISVCSEISQFITIRKVGLVPSEMPAYADHDDNILRSTPGLYPDPLIPLDSADLTLLPNQWRTLWITIDPNNKVDSGQYPIKILFETSLGEELGIAEFELNIINAILPKQELIHTQWFHTDCLATWYKVDVFSEEHWEIIGKYVVTAVKHGINMILTPLFTPPLDTVIGGERPTVQLVDVEKSGDIYKFGFTKLKRWIDMCLSLGVEYFELSHLFTQWGAHHAPKIIAQVNGEFVKIFGWDTDASGNNYKEFLSVFLPELISFINENNIQSKCYFHISDEPSPQHLDSYKNASEIINQYVKNFPIIDALSSYEFYETGLVKTPIPATNHIEPFLENEVPNLWTYYCCSQYKEVSNRFFNFPSVRNRILGFQLYKFNIHGFLQWGYNFWYSQYSKHPIDPFKVTDAGHAFPSGDAFSVYPGENGPLSSLKFEVFYEALQDLRALRLLEKSMGRAKVIQLLEEGLDNPITFSDYPTDTEWLLKKREKINKMILKDIVLDL